jgi:hypothetical protein
MARKKSNITRILKSCWTGARLPVVFSITVTTEACASIRHFALFAISPCCSLLFQGKSKLRGSSSEA